MGRGRVQTAQPGDISVRRATPQDHIALYGVYYRSVREGAAAFYTEEQRTAWAPSSQPTLPHAAPDDTLLRWIAEVDGEIVGFMAITPDGYIDLAFVLPEWMGRGVAQAVYDRMLVWARRNGLMRLSAHASHFARRFFEKQGWQVDYPETLARNGQELERFFMSFELENRDEKTL